MTSPSVSPVESGAPVGGLSGVRERLIEAAAEWTSNYCAEAILAAVLPLIAQALDDERADSDEPAWHVDPEINSAWQWGMRRAAALVRSWAADGAR